jgi:hypothetical protein
LAGVRNAQLNLARENAFLEDMELDVSHGLARGIRNLDANYILAQTHFNRWVAADREVKSATAVYEQGVGQGITPLNQLLDAVRRRGRAQQAYYLAITEYNKSIADVHMRKGSILEYNGVMFEEGPWPKKAYWDALARARERDASTYLDYGWTRPKVISRGPQPQAPQSGFEGLTPVEELPTTEPTPAEEPGEGPLPERIPSEAGPEAAQHSVPGSRRMALSETAASDIFWNGFEPPSGAVQQASYSEDVNALR